MMAPMEFEAATLRRLRVAALIEGTTLVCLLFVAVPLKHVFHLPLAVQVLGPIHGVAFLGYFWTLMTALTTVSLRRFELARLVVGAFIPFASFFNERWLKKREMNLLSPPRPQ